MAIIQLLDRPKNIIYIVWDGDTTAEKWLDQARQLVAQPDWRAISRLIADVHTAANPDTIGDKAMEAVAALFGTQLETVRKKRIAVLASDLFGRTRTLSTLLAPLGVSMVVFNHLDTACTFLGINPADTQQTLEQLRLKLRSEGS